jgi:glucokinase
LIATASRAAAGSEAIGASDPAAANVLAVDLGATYVRAGLVTDGGGIVRQVKESTLVGDGDASSGADRIARLVASAFGHRPAKRAVVGVPGRVNYTAGTLEQANNLLPGWSGTLSAVRLAESLGLPVELASDADLAGVGEAYFGAGSDTDDVAFLTISSGVGSAAITRRRVHAGTRKLVEVGNFVVDRRAFARGEPCTVDELGSGRALERRVAEAGLGISPRDVPTQARAGDQDAARLWNDIIDVAAIAAVNLAQCYAPQVLVVGGAVGLEHPSVLDAIRSAVTKHGPRGEVPTPEVRPAAFGDDAALVGAAAWAQAMGGSS